MGDIAWVRNPVILTKVDLSNSNTIKLVKYISENNIKKFEGKYISGTERNMLRRFCINNEKQHQ
jgi:hypothetical protein